MNYRRVRTIAFSFVSFRLVLDTESTNQPKSSMVRPISNVSMHLEVRRAVRLGLYTADDHTPSQPAADIDDNLFANILNNPDHVQHKFLPDRTDHTYNLRSRRHSLSLTVVTDCNNFVNRLLSEDIH